VELQFAVSLALKPPHPAVWLPRRRAQAEVVVVAHGEEGVVEVGVDQEVLTFRAVDQEVSDRTIGLGPCLVALRGIAFVPDRVLGSLGYKVPDGGDISHGAAGTCRYLYVVMLRGHREYTAGS